MLSALRGKEKEKAFHSKRISGCLAVADASDTQHFDLLVFYFDCVTGWHINKDVRKL